MTHISSAGPLIREVPLSRLALAPENVRKTPPDDLAQAELAASIRAHGLLENLVARADKPDTEDAERFAVVAGGRRLAALRTLAEDGAIPADHPVPCLIKHRTATRANSRLLRTSSASPCTRPTRQLPSRAWPRPASPSPPSPRASGSRSAWSSSGSGSATPLPSSSTPTAPGRSTSRPSRRSRSRPTMPGSGRCGSRSRGRATARPRGR